MNKEKRIPEIRFAGFTDDWEQRKFNDIVKRLSKTSDSNEIPKVEFEDIIAGEGRLNKDVSKKFDNRKGIIFNRNNILYGKLRPYLKNWLLADFEGIALGDFWVFESKGSEPDFVYSLIQAGKYQKVANDTSGTKMPRSDWKRVSTTPFLVPNFNEQTKIGQLFRELDNTIALHQQLLSDYKQLKKAMLQQMIPQKGETVPKVRFAGFSHEWKKRKLSSLYEKGGSGGTPRSTNKAYYTGNIPFLGISDISASNGYIYETQKYISEEGLNNSSAWLVPAEAISLAMYASVGKVAILKTNVATSQAFYNMVFENLSTRNFTFQYLLKMEYTQGWRKLISTGTQANLNAKKVQSFKIMIPSIEEQEKIGQFFKELDEIIEGHEQKLATYQELKKALLQRMFV